MADVTMTRRRFIERTVGCAVVAVLVNDALAQLAPAASAGTNGLPAAGTYRAGRIVNEYSHFLPGEAEALATAPSVTEVGTTEITVRLGEKSQRLKVNDSFEGWRLLTICPIEGAPTAVFEKHVTHRGALAYVREGASATLIPKQVGQLSQVRPRQINTPHVRFERPTSIGPDTVGQYILDGIDDPSYENVAALGPEFVGWTLVANEEAGPEHSLYLDPAGRSRQRKSVHYAQPQWGPDATGPLFDPVDFALVFVGGSFHSKRTLLGGDLPVADVAVWDPVQGLGYETLVLLPLGRHPTPMGRIRASNTPEMLLNLGLEPKEWPEVYENIVFHKEGDEVYLEQYWNCSAAEFHQALWAICKHWHAFHEGGMRVRIPDEWLVNAAQAGLTLTRCSYTGLEPTYQLGEGAYTQVPPRSHALFPVAHSEFVWAHQLWNQTESADRYFQHYLDHYILPSGDFLYNTQEQIEAPLNVGVFLSISARSYFYTRSAQNLEKRLPTLERMIGFIEQRYQYSKTNFRAADRRRGLIWGSPEADLANPLRDFPDSHPYYYQNAVWIWRGLNDHARALNQAAKDSGRADFKRAGARYEALARQMRQEIEASLRATIAAGTAAMRREQVTPFTPDDTHRDPKHLENYENHRMMEDWFLADWGDTALDQGHFRQRQASGRQLLGLGTAYAPDITSNFMAHGTLSYLIRQDDYRPFLLALYALTCYTADSGNRYSPEDTFIPGGQLPEGAGDLWSAVVNSALQPTLGLRWLLCYEESDVPVCHLQKAAPKHWFAEGEVISVQKCPTRFGTLSWSTQAVTDRSWQLEIEASTEFAAQLTIHIHPPQGGTLNTTSVGKLQGNRILLAPGTLKPKSRLKIQVS